MPLNALKRSISQPLFKPSTRLKLLCISLREAVVRRVLQRLEPQNTHPNQLKLIRETGFDVLVILDACRYDYMASLAAKYLKGASPVRPVSSPASTTPTWLSRAWRVLGPEDVVYVSANPMIGRSKTYGIGKTPFMHVEEVWRTGWSDDYSTVPPSRTTLAALMLVKRLRRRGFILGEDYRLVIHYAQPHAPYRLLAPILTPLTAEIRERIARTPLDNIARGLIAPDYATLGILYDTLRSKTRVDKILRAAYRDNLAWALKTLPLLLRRLQGYAKKIIITADHGELLGEYGLYFHFEAPLPQLRTIPWITVSRGA